MAKNRNAISLRYGISKFIRDYLFTIVSSSLSGKNPQQMSFNVWLVIVALSCHCVTGMMALYFFSSHIHLPLYIDIYFPILTFRGLFVKNPVESYETG